MYLDALILVFGCLRKIRISSRIESGNVSRNRKKARKRVQ